MVFSIFYHKDSLQKKKPKYIGISGKNCGANIPTLGYIKMLRLREEIPRTALSSLCLPRGFYNSTKFQEIKIFIILQYTVLLGPFINTLISGRSWISTLQHRLNELESSRRFSRKIHYHAKFWIAQKSTINTRRKKR